ncbi:hypothetical protein Tfer_0715 [Thermincola ferriacetica]|uniref:DUF458 domain-containing protein n=1 Tax=Thermincola ferriacetica TaxID=281456 RepID=A0A0L6W595_9FIRM|nr:ribonuclease H-like YkuK family protein [Thermincola ferriacetica]KNZ70533.1 hypothetical protein Tfer_0715 [Thermincola ferriacetica]
MRFISPSKGSISLEEMVTDLINFTVQSPKDSYRIIIGTDSQQGEKTCFVTAVIIHRAGKGAKFYYRRTYHKPYHSLQQRIFAEANESLDIAARLMEKLSAINPELTIEIHLDVGTKGKTKELIQQVVGMVNMSGFLARVKPYSYGASKVADRYTK